MYPRLYKSLDKFNCLYKKQSGFENSHSTNYALAGITEEIRKALDNDEFACGVFLDFEKAFDAVNHEILIAKRNHYEIRGIALDWFKSYLTNRTQLTSIEGELPAETTITCGVPQGPLLGLLLLLIYIYIYIFINDLNEVILHSLIHHFANDTNILVCNKLLKKINNYVNHDLSHIVQWLRANRFSLNAGKMFLV